MQRPHFFKQWRVIVARGRFFMRQPGPDIGVVLLKKRFIRVQCRGVQPLHMPVAERAKNHVRLLAATVPAAIFQAAQADVEGVLRGGHNFTLRIMGFWVNLLPTQEMYRENFMTLPYRADDAVLTVCQNNAKQSIEIHNANDALARLVSVSVQELEGAQLTDILPPDIRQVLVDYLEFDDATPDISQVLKKVKDFRLLARGGAEIPLSLRTTRSESKDGQAWFRFIMRQPQAQREQDVLLETLRQQFSGHAVLDPQLQVPDRASLLRDMGIVRRHTDQINMCFALVALDDYGALNADHGREACDAMMRHVAKICENRLRGHDVVGGISSSELGVLLLDSESSSSRMVLNRLRWLVGSQPFTLPGKTEVTLTISVTFANLTDYADDAELVRECVTAMERLQAEGKNLIDEVRPPDTAPMVRTL